MGSNKETKESTQPRGDHTPFDIHAKPEILVIVTILRTISLWANTANYRKGTFKRTFPPLYTTA